MQTGKSTVKDIFDGTRILNVPTYQRAYSWEREANLEDFVNDLFSQQPERPYFFGSFLFHLNGQKSEFAMVDIVDGQQRLTTLVIFMHTLLGCLIAKSSNKVSERTRRIFVRDGDVFKLESANEGNAFLHDLVLGDRIYRPDEVSLVTNSQRLLLDARQFFEERLAEFDLPTLERIYVTAVSADVLLYVVEDISMATQIFELLNDRGRKLTALESIKSFLMYNAGIVQKHPEQLIGKIQEDFAAIYRLIESHKINDRDVLRYHMRAFEKYPADYIDKPKTYIKERILRLVADHQMHDLAATEIRAYPNRLKKSFELFAQLQDLRLTDHELAKVFMIGRVAPFYPVLMRVFSERRAEFPRLIAAISAFTFRSSLARLKSNGESYQSTYLRNDGDVLGLIENFVKDNWWNINGRAREALDYHNYYEWLEKNIVRYILVSYENELRGKKGFPLMSFKDYSSTDLRTKLSIEHVTAQRVKDVEFDEAFREDFLHSIGNLVIDHAASNSSKGSKGGVDKMEQYSLAPLMSQNQINEGGVDWLDIESIKSFIRAREDKLKAFVSAKFGV